MILLSAFDEKAPADLFGDKALSPVRAIRDRRVGRMTHPGRTQRPVRRARSLPRAASPARGVILLPG